MAVICCYTNIHPAAAKAIEEHAPQTQLIDVTGDDFAYWREIRTRWNGTEDLVIIEQDNEILPDSVSSMLECGHDWCCYAYPIFRSQQRLRYGLGCTKISAKAQQLVNPRGIAEGFALCKNCKGKGCWYHLDGRIAEVLRGAGLKPHVHGDVIHHHKYDEQPAVEVRGRAIEHYEEDWGNTPQALIIADHWPRSELYAVNQRQAIAIAADLERLHGEYGNDPEEFVMPPAGFATDKISHGYLPVYSRLAKVLGPAARVCEIGVERGGSLDLWRAMFPQATIAGVDRNPEARWPEGSIRIVASQDDPDLPKILDSHEEAWDLIVDDASHDGALTGKTLSLLWKLVSPGGFYVIEDWFVGFGNYPEYDDSMLRLAKSLLDRLDPFYAETIGHFTDVESVEYRHGMAILRKRV